MATEPTGDEAQGRNEKHTNDHTEFNVNDQVVGLVIRSWGAFFDAHFEGANITLRCQIRGKLKKNLIYPRSKNLRRQVQSVRRIQAVNPVAVGDRVRVRRLDETTGVIEEILPRLHSFIRRASGDIPLAQTLLAGADQVIIVFAATDPKPHHRMIDRFLAIAEAGEVEPIIVFNKADLILGEDDPEEESAEDEVEENDPYSLAEMYRRIGYSVLWTSASALLGLEELRERLAGKTSALVGPSGVGKSSLLNALKPGLGAAVGRVNAITGRGRHTTSSPVLVPLGGPRGGYVADTPGIRTLALWQVAPEDLAECFPEMRPFITECRLPDCMHLDEPDCAIAKEVARGHIDPRRYDSFIRLRETMVEE